MAPTKHLVGNWLILSLGLGLLGCGPEEACPSGYDESGNCAAAGGTGGQGTGSVTGPGAQTGAGTQADGDSETGSARDTGAGNNWACMSDGDFPAGISDDPSLRRVIPYTVIGGSTSLELGAMTISRMTPTSEFTRTQLPVTNVSDSAWCFIQIEALSFSDGQSELINDGDAFVDGSVGDLGNGLYTDTCLAAGESGYVLTITEVGFDQVSEASLVLEDPDVIPAAALDVVVVPTGYVVAGSDAEVTLEHVDGQDATVSDRAVWLLRGSNAEPVIWGLAEALDEQLLSQGDTHQYQISESFLEQVGSSLCVWVDFSPVTTETEFIPPVACAPSLDPERCEKQRWDARTLRIAAARDATR